jgi:ubiquinone/menaquinone biosynthesis C-methylase UbiE
MASLPAIPQARAHPIMDNKKLVQAGYNAIAAEYLTTRTDTSEDVLLLQELVRRLPIGAKVLDAGCGAGVPVTNILSESFDVTGVDFAQTQIEMARQLVPNATFICHDVVDLDLPDGSFDAVCSYYAIIHIPRLDHQKLLRNFHRLLTSGGLALLCMGANDIEHDIDEHYHGSPMYWSHYDAATNLAMLAEAGFEIILSKAVTYSTCPTSQHLFVLAERKSS